MQRRRTHEELDAEQRASGTGTATVLDLLDVRLHAGAALSDGVVDLFGDIVGAGSEVNFTGSIFEDVAGWGRADVRERRQSGGRRTYRAEMMSTWLGKRSRGMAAAKTVEARPKRRAGRESLTILPWDVMLCRERRFAGSEMRENEA